MSSAQNDQAQKDLNTEIIFNKFIKRLLQDNRGTNECEKPIIQKKHSNNSINIK